MPIPSPSHDESHEDFMSRCMGDHTMVKEYEEKQRAAICYGQWHPKKKERRARALDALDRIKSALAP